MLLAVMLKSGWAGFALDRPNQRSLHATPVPRTGGLALMAGLLVGALFLPSRFWFVLLIAGALLLVSFWDDVRGLPVFWRFLAHFVVAGVFVEHYGLTSLGFFWVIMVLLTMVWMTNLYNFMDGSDGLAGGMALIGFGFYGIAASMHGNGALSMVSASIAASSLAFLLFNFYPAKVFMGDAGSIPLGFLAAALGMLGWRDGVWPVWFPVMVFSPFILDASVTLLKRFLHGEKVWKAHCGHYYQRLVQMGWGHRRTALAEYVLMALAGASATWTIGQDGRTQLVFGIGWGVAYLLAMWLVDVKWARVPR